MRPLPVSCLLAAAVALGSTGASAQPTIPNTMKLHLTIDGKTITATLADTAASRDFTALLPLELLLTDYAATEKVGDLPRKLHTAGALPGYAPKAGDIAYYAPWGNLAIFHKAFQYSAGLVKLGTLDNGLDTIRTTGRVRARITLADEARP